MKQNRNLSFLTKIIQLITTLLLVSCSDKLVKTGSEKPIAPVLETKAKHDKFYFPLLDDPLAGQWSIAFYDIDNDSLIFGYDENRALVPASLQKLLTTGAVLKLFNGGEQSFSTEIKYDGEIDKKNRSLNGNLIIYGNYDPSLGYTYLKDSTVIELTGLAKYLKEKTGIDKITGKIIYPQAKDAAFSYPSGWEYEDLSTYYAPMITPLAIAENSVRLRIRNDSISIFPAYPLAIKKDTVSWSGTVVRKIGWTDSLIISADFKQEINETIPVSQPYYLFDLVFTKILKQQKIVVENQILPVGQSKELTSIKGKRISDLAKRSNTNSDNFFAEELFCAVVKKFAEDSLKETTKSRYPEERAAIAKKMYGAVFGLDNLAVTDGSGLSRRNYISAMHFTKVLAEMSKRAEFDTYLASLSTPGRDGTLRKRLLSEQFSEKVFAKTGSMSGVNNLAGYMMTDSGKRVAFVVLNNYFFYPKSEMNQKIEEILSIISIKY